MIQRKKEVVLQDLVVQGNQWDVIDYSLMCSFRAKKMYWPKKDKKKQSNDDDRIIDNEMTMDGIIEVEEKKETNKLYKGMFINLTIYQ